MNIKNTPGPWTGQPGDNFITDAAGIVICEMHRHHTDEEIAANAALITAAPDLLEALQALSSLPEYDGTGTTSKQRLAVKDRVRAAIAKATGVEA